MGIYGNCVLPRLIHLAMRHPVARERREALVPQASGSVLEIGIGSGLNLPYYSAGAHRLLGVDPSEPLLRLAKKTTDIRGIGPSQSGLGLVCGSAERLPFPDRSFDSLLMTWTLCSIPEPRTALVEMRRVLKVDGRLFFIEHGLAPDDSVRRWQRRLTPMWRRIAGGCHLDRRVDQLIESAGFRIEALDTQYVRGPRLLTYFYEGRASPTR